MVYFVEFQKQFYKINFQVLKVNFRNSSKVNFEVLNFGTSKDDFKFMILKKRIKIVIEKFIKKSLSKGVV